MSDYIDRQAAIDAMTLAIEDDWEVGYATDRMNELPSAGVVEVIRCKDCIYADTYLARPKRVFCCKFGENMEQTDFCSKGEKNDLREKHIDQEEWFEEMRLQ